MPGRIRPGRQSGDGAGAVSEIEVAISPGPSGYRVDVVRSPAGEAAGQTTLDVHALLGQRKALEDAVLLSSVQTRAIFPEEQRIREVGRELFRALFGAGPVASRFRAAERDDDLRIVLRVNDPALAGLPWEAMYDDESGGYVCRRHQLVRHVGVPATAAPLTVTPPLRVLGVVSSPRGLAPLDVEKEKEQLSRALSRLTTDGLVELAWAPSATWADLQDTLLGGTWHVLHFIGHGDFDPGHGLGMLALTGDNGRMQMVDGSRFVDLLRQARPVPRLVVLNSCSGAASSVTDLFSGTAAALVRGGVTAVAAMQYEITDDAAIAFARGFYTAIARGRGVDEAVSSARVAILGLSSRTLEWVTPVLYLRGTDAHLFTLPATPTAAPALAPSPARTPGPAPARPNRPVPDHTVRVLTGHTDDVNFAAFSPNGALLATTSDDRTAKVWDADGGTLIRSLTGHTDTVYGVAFNPDGDLLATASADKTARLWSVAAGTPIRSLTGHTNAVIDVAFSPDGTLLATASADATVRLWDTATWTSVRTFSGHAHTVTGVAFSPHGVLLATASADKTVRLWEVATGTPLRSLTGHAGTVTGVAYSPDGETIATCSTDGTARQWDAMTGNPLDILASYPDMIIGITFSPDGTLIGAATGNAVLLWERATGTLLRTLTGHDDTVNGLAFSPDGTLLATTGDDHTASLWGAG
jgi:WD40 repeat protein